MTVSDDEDLRKLKRIGQVVARTMAEMGRALRPGITTQELDDLGGRLLAAAGARSAPQVTYGFPGVTCISVNEEIAHGIPGDRVIAEGDLVNIDVSAELDGFFADTGASFTVGRAQPAMTRLCRDGKRALWAGIGQVGPGRRMAAIGEAIGRFAQKNGYTLIRNLASHGVGTSLHEEPAEIPTWPDASERRIMQAGMVFTIEPFLSLGGDWAVEADGDPWTLYSRPQAFTVQYEHTLVVTPRGPLVVTLPA
jgi:methionyl aminopeptidase